MLNETQLPASRVPVTESDATPTRAWFRFFSSLYNFVGLGNGVVPPTSGGTGNVTYAAGDILYAPTANTLARLPAPSVAIPSYLGTQTTNIPQWLPLFAAQVPTTVNAATYTILVTDFSLRITTTNCTLTLPAASAYPGRILNLSTITANSLTSASGNVIPLGSSTAGTAILAATAGKFAMLQSDNTNWVTLMAN